MTASTELELMMKDYRLATAEILYHMPDHPHLLQTYVWQGYDVAPKFPTLKRFLDFWEDNLDGPLHSVRLCSARMLRPSELRHAKAALVLH